MSIDYVLSINNVNQTFCLVPYTWNVSRNVHKHTVRYCYLRFTDGGKHQYLVEEVVETGLKS